MLSVKPMHQRKGVATEILRYCLAQAEEAQLPIFLVSFPRPHDWYLRWGFEDLESFDTDLSEWGPRYCGFGIYRTYGMCRRPRPGAI